MADAFAKVRARAEQLSAQYRVDQSDLLRELRPIQRQALGILLQNKAVTTAEMADYLGLKPRQARDLCVKWIADGFLIVVNPTRRARTYGLAPRFEAVI